MELEQEDQAKTVFTCQWGLFEFTRMPFGLCNAPATFQRLMDRILRDYILTIYPCMYLLISICLPTIVFSTAKLLTFLIKLRFK